MYFILLNYITFQRCVFLIITIGFIGILKTM